MSHIFEVTITEGPAVCGPLLNTDTGDYVWYIAFNGALVLKNGKFGPESSFPTQEIAEQMASSYAEYMGWEFKGGH